MRRRSCSAAADFVLGRVHHFLFNLLAEAAVLSRKHLAFIMAHIKHDASHLPLFIFCLYQSYLILVSLDSGIILDGSNILKYAQNYFESSKLF